MLDFNNLVSLFSEKTLPMKRLLFLFAFLWFSAVIFAQDYRYINPVFSQIVPDTGLVYTVAPALNPNYGYLYEDSVYPDTLKVDVFMPYNDTLTQRPLIIFIHGGGFIEGNRHHDDMMAFCDTFAHAGYVTATIDYRQGFYLDDDTLTPIGSARAVYRGLQDIHAAIRYFKANASTFQIDTNRIYLVGSSAGAFMALHDLFMNNDERPPATYDTAYTVTDTETTTLGTEIITHVRDTAPDLGPIDIGPNLGHIGVANAIVSLWGALGDTSYVQSTEIKPIFLVHGEADTVVPFGYGIPFNGASPYIPPTYGSELIAKRLTNLGDQELETYFVPGANHEFYGATNGEFLCDTCPNQYWDTIVTDIKVFFNNLQKPYTSVSYTTSDNITYTFTGTYSSDVVYKKWIIDNDSVIPDSTSITYTFTTSGTHTVTFYVANRIASWDTATAVVNVNIASALNKVSGIQTIIYPNPAKYYVYVKTGSDNVTVQLISPNGQILRQQKGSRLIQIPVADLPDGMYLLRIINDKGVLTRKFIKN